MSIRVYTISSVLARGEYTGTLADAIFVANNRDKYFRPEHGTQVELEGETLYSTQWPTFAYATDSEIGELSARDFRHACFELDEKLTSEMVQQGAWGFVQDKNGKRYKINC
jgi:hypothetical protein